MKLPAIVLSVFFVLSLSVASAQQQRYDRVQVNLDASHTIADLAALGIEADHGQFRKGISLTTDLSASEVQRIAAAGFSYQVLIQDVATYYAQQRAPISPASPRTVTCSSPFSYNVQTPANFHGGSMGGFLTYAELLTQLDSMHAKYPNLISARNVIDTFHSIEGRPLYWLRISNHPDSDQTQKPQILYTALHHAREPAGLTDMMFYMWYLLENYQTSAEVRALVDHTEMYIVPCVNPDGYIYNETTNPTGGGMWRKNRRHNADSTYGVDLNRNYGYNWGYDNTGSSNVTTDETYRGTAGFSEPEIAAMKFFAEHHHFSIAVNYHTYSNMLIYPWGYEAGLLTPDSDLYIAYARTMTKYNGFLYGTGDQTVGYTTNGDSDDWMYGEQNTKNKILSMTPESGSQAYGFWPPASAVTDVAKENFDLIFYAHKFLLRHLELTDISPKVTLSHQFKFTYQAEQLGLDTPSVYTLSLTSSDPNVTVPSTVRTITNPALLSTVTDSFLIQLSPNITNGSTFSFAVVVDNGLYTYADTITKKFISGDTLYYNNCNSAATFTHTGSWGTTSSSYTSPAASITDSPNGNYPNNSTTSITLTDTIDLTHATSASLLYQARWQLEKSYDYVLTEASADGQSWSPLCGLYTNVGQNQNNAYQSLYDGYQNEWVQEVIDLGDYTGHKTMLRFTLSSDQYLNYDGFYFDDLTVLAQIDSAATGVKSLTGSSDWTIYPNPASDRVMIAPATVSGSLLTVYDAMGAEVKKILLTNENVSVADLAPGAYFASISHDGQSSPMHKLIIVR